MSFVVAVTPGFVPFRARRSGGREGNAKDTPRHWTMGASMEQASGATSGKRKMVSLSTCAAKLLYARGEGAGCVCWGGRGRVQRLNLNILVRVICSINIDIHTQNQQRSDVQQKRKLSIL